MGIWRGLLMYLALLLVVYTANFAAVPFSSFLDQNPVKLNAVEVSEQAQLSFSGENDDFEGYFNPQRGLRATAPAFAAQIQAEPDYVLEIEFLATELAAAFFKHLSNPPLAPIWHQQLTQTHQASRISGWKDGNSLYAGTITYHS